MILDSNMDLIFGELSSRGDLAAMDRGGRISMWRK